MKNKSRSFQSSNRIFWTIGLAFGVMFSVPATGLAGEPVIKYDKQFGGVLEFYIEDKRDQALCGQMPDYNPDLPGIDISKGRTAKQVQMLLASYGALRSAWQRELKTINGQLPGLREEKPRQLAPGILLSGRRFELDTRILVPGLKAASAAEDCGIRHPLDWVDSMNICFDHGYDTPWSEEHNASDVLARARALNRKRWDAFSDDFRGVNEHVARSTGFESEIAQFIQAEFQFAYSTTCRWAKAKQCEKYSGYAEAEAGRERFRKLLSERLQYRYSAQVCAELRKDRLEFRKKQLEERLHTLSGFETLKRRELERLQRPNGSKLPAQADPSADSSGAGIPWSAAAE